jgi:hypothetical protein
MAFNRRTLYRKLHKIPISSPELISPINLGLALPTAPVPRLSQRGDTGCVRHVVGDDYMYRAGSNRWRKNLELLSGDGVRAPL